MREKASEQIALFEKKHMQAHKSSRSPECKIESMPQNLGGVGSRVKSSRLALST